MDDETGALQAAAHGKKSRCHHGAAVSFKDLRPDDEIGDVGLVFERHEYDALRGPWALAYQNQACDCDDRILCQSLVAKLRVADCAERCKSFAEEVNRMLFQRQSGRHIILNDVLAQRHLW